MSSSRSQRRGNELNLDAEINEDVADLQERIHRMKLLSKAQTGLLKAHLHGKLTSMNEIVAKALDELKQTGKHATVCTDLESDLSKLKIAELEVDVKSVQLTMHEALAELRASVERKNAANPPPPPPGASPEEVAQLQKKIISLEAEIEALRRIAASAVVVAPPAPPAIDTSGLQDTIRLLDTDNQTLRRLLKESKDEVAALNIKVEEASAKQSSNNTATSAELDAAKSEIANLKRQIAELASEKSAAADAGDAARKEASSLKEELESTNKKLATVQAELSSTSASSASVGAESEKLRAHVEELKASLEAAATEKDALQKNLVKESNDKIAKLVKKFEQEKEEIMEVVSQEVEEVEKRVQKEKEDLNKENARLLALNQNAGKRSKDNLRKISALKAAVQSMGQNQKRLVEETNRSLNEYKSLLKTELSVQVMNKMKAYGVFIEEYKRKYKRELAERKRLHNLVQELKGNIRVFLRCRPPSTREIEQFGNDALCVSFPDDNQIRVVNEKGRDKMWDFDQVFNLESTQEEVYAEVSDLVISVLDGYNVCIFAYGQTGSGKTYTMAGPEHDKGVNLRALNELFTKARSRADEIRDVISVSILEVYNETINDLLVSGGGDEKLEVRQGEFGNFVPGLTNVPVASLEEVSNLLSTADRNRSQACTNMNEHSSRSHMMLTVSVVSESLITGQTTRGKLNLVDLAGSERLDKSGATGQALKEAQNINKSLSALGDVIQARASKQGHVPFRNSTLTYLLQDSLSQDSKTLMFVCISPVLYNAEESFCSLNFAARVRTVELGRATKQVVSATATGTGGSAPTAARAAPAGTSSIARPSGIKKPGVSIR